MFPQRHVITSAWQSVFRVSVALIVVLMLTPIASASERHSQSSISTSLWGSRYWDGFVEFWTEAFRKQNGVVMLVLGAGALSIFIITRGKKLK